MNEINEIEGLYVQICNTGAKILELTRKTTPPSVSIAHLDFLAFSFTFPSPQLYFYLALNHSRLHSLSLDLAPVTALK